MFFRVHCGLEISPSASETEVHWTMGLHPLVPSHSFLPFGARLLFLVVDSSLEGEYTCTYNGQVASYFLEVLGKSLVSLPPTLTLSLATVPPRIVNITSDLRVTADKAVHLHCGAIGKPTPQVSEVSHKHTALQQYCSTHSLTNPPSLPRSLSPDFMASRRQSIAA